MLDKIENAMIDRYGRRGRFAYGYYQEDRAYVSIYKRQPLSPMKKDSEVKVHAGFMKYIIDQKDGYIGDITVNFDEGRFPLVKELLEDINNKTNHDTLMAETNRFTSVEGINHRLCYLQDGEVRFENYHSWQVAYDGDDIFNPDAAYIFYDKVDVEGEKTYYINKYDSDNVTIYRKGSKFDAWSLVEEKPHFFRFVPVYPFLNNNDMIGDISPNNINTIDQYDEIQSDVLSEIKANRLAYLLVSGELQDIPYTASNGNPVVAEDGNLQYMPQSEYFQRFRTLLFKTNDDGKPLGDARYLEKRLDDAVVEHNLDRLRSQIFFDASAIDSRELTIGANVRHMAIKAAFDRLERKVVTYIRYLNKSLKRQYELILGLAVDGYIGFSLSEADAEECLKTMEISYNHRELVDDHEIASTHAINMRNMSYRDAYALNPNTNHDPDGYAERYEQQLKDDVYIPEDDIIV